MVWASPASVVNIAGADAKPMDELVGNRWWLDSVVPLARLAAVRSAVRSSFHALPFMLGLSNLIADLRYICLFH